ncbi:MAG: Bug family tripartite tricarboxylate transporter substrate binding protein [Lautropia sp.]
MPVIGSARAPSRGHYPGHRSGPAGSVASAPRRLGHALLRATCAAALCIAGAAAAQPAPSPATAPAATTPADGAWPTRPVRIVIGFTPGGGIDTLARLLAPKLAEQLKQSFVVENKPGANGVLATQSVAAAPADGHTVLLGTTGNLSVNPVFITNPPFDMDRDFAPVTQLVSLAFLVMSDPALPVSDLAGLIRYAKANPGKSSFGSSGTGGLPHLAAQLLSDQAGMAAVHVPYKGSAPALADVMGGQVPFFIDAPAIGLPHIKSGKLRALATTGAKRLELLPDVPTVAETIAGFDVVNWYGMVVPAATPPSAIRALQSAIAGALADPEIRQKVLALGMDPVASTPEAFGRFMKDESARWGRVIRDAKIKPE